MKITVSMAFESVEDLIAFYERVRNDDPTDYVEPVTVKVAEPIYNEQPASMEAPAPVTEEPPVKQTVHTRDEVKAYCTTARVEKGVKIKDILLSLGVGSFKDLPDDRLDDLYDAVTAARGD